MIVVSNCGTQLKPDNSASSGMRITQDHNTESPTNPDAEGKESDGNECVKGAATKNEGVSLLASANCSMALLLSFGVCLE